MINKLFPYYGGKYDFLPEIYEVLGALAPGRDRMLDLFGGSGVVTAMVRAYLPQYQVSFNDLHHAMAVTMEGVRDHPAFVADYVVRFTSFMAEARSVEAAKDRFKTIMAISESDEHPATLAAATIARFIYSFSGVGRSMHGIDYKSGRNEADKRYNHCLNVAESVIPEWSALLQGVKITELPFQDAVASFVGRRDPRRLVIYADPPYISYNGMSDGSGYTHRFEPDDFEEFAGLVRTVPCTWVISHKADQNFERLMGPADGIRELHKNYHSTVNQHGGGKTIAHERLYLYNA